MSTTHYRGHEIRRSDRVGSTPVYYVTTTETDTYVCISEESARARIDAHVQLEHLWLADFRELVRLIRGERSLPHPVAECSVCDKAFDTTLRARRRKIHEEYQRLIDIKAQGEEVLSVNGSL